MCVFRVKILHEILIGEYVILAYGTLVVRRLRTTHCGENSDGVDSFVFGHGEKDATSPGVFPSSFAPEKV